VPKRQFEWFSDDFQRKNQQKIVSRIADLIDKQQLLRTYPMLDPRLREDDEYGRGIQKSKQPHF